MIITATLIMVAAMESRTMNREKLRCGVKATLRAIKAEIFTRLNFNCKNKGWRAIATIFLKEWGVLAILWE
jgi:hypothetical protein